MPRKKRTPFAGDAERESATKATLLDAARAIDREAQWRRDFGRAIDALLALIDERAKWFESPGVGSAHISAALATAVDADDFATTALDAVLADLDDALATSRADEAKRKVHGALLGGSVIGQHELEQLGSALRAARRPDPVIDGRDAIDQLADHDGEVRSRAVMVEALGVDPRDLSREERAKALGTEVHALDKRRTRRRSATLAGHVAVLLGRSVDALDTRRTRRRRPDR